MMNLQNQILHPQTKYQPLQPKFGNDDDLFNSSAFDDTKSDYSSTKPVDYSERSGGKKKLRATDGYKSTHKAASSASRTFTVFGIAGLILSGMTGFIGLVERSEVSGDNPHSEYEPFNDARDKIEDKANQVEAEINFLTEALGENDQGAINAELRNEVYNYLSTIDTHVNDHSPTKSDIRLRDYIRVDQDQLTDEQYEALTAMFEELIATETLDDFRLVANTMMDEYIIPAAQATETSDDNVDAVRYKKALEEFYEGIDAEVSGYQKILTFSKVALAGALINGVLAYGLSNLPKPIHNEEEGT